MVIKGVLISPICPRVDILNTICRGQNWQRTNFYERHLPSGHLCLLTVWHLKQADPRPALLQLSHRYFVMRFVTSKAPGFVLGSSAIGYDPHPVRNSLLTLQICILTIKKSFSYHEQPLEIDKSILYFFQCNYLQFTIGIILTLFYDNKGPVKLL